MIKVTKTISRPNANISTWFTTTDGKAYNEYRTIIYGTKITSPMIDLSTDNLTLTYSSVWYSQESFDEMMADPVIQRAISDFNEYNLKNGIIDHGTVITPV
jgi:hypothetical protein